MDLRAKVAAALETTDSSLRVAARFGVSSSFVRKLRLRQRQTGDIAARPLPGRERLVKHGVELELSRIVSEHPDATLNVLREMLQDATGVAVSETTMWRQLLRMGITLKKKSFTRPKGTGRT